MTKLRYDQVMSEHNRTQKMLLIIMTMLAFDHDHSQWFRYFLFTLMAVFVGIDILVALYKGVKFLMSIRIRKSNG